MNIDIFFTPSSKDLISFLIIISASGLKGSVSMAVINIDAGSELLSGIFE